MKRLLLVALVISLLMTGGVFAQDEADTDESLPLVTMTIFDPWSVVIGSDSPVFTLYEDGQVIFQRTNEDGDWELASVQLDEDERDALLEQIISEAFFELDNYYDSLLLTDQPSTIIEVFTYEDDLESDSKMVSVYGSLFAEEAGSELSARETTPEAFLQAFDMMIGFNLDEAERWTPEYAEIVIWPYDYSDPTRWPDRWPGLDDELTVKRDSVYSLYLPFEKYPRFLELSDDASAFLIDGETWAFSVRLPLPHEFAEAHRVD